MSWFKTKNKKSKQLNLFAVSATDNQTNFLTLTLTQDEALEYVQQRVFVKHFEHFKMWCNIRNYDIHDKAAKQEYTTQCIDLEEYNDYLVHSLSYKYTDLVAILRMFGGCIPIGCTFDTPAELQFVTSLITPNPIEEQIEEMQKDGQ